MILFVTALQAEAKPVIRHYRLKKDMSAKAFPVYRNGEIALVISGVGKLRAAAATAFLLTGTEAKNTLLVNLGICGIHESSAALPKTIFTAQKVTDMDTGRDYYPDLCPEIPIKSRNLYCFSSPVTKEDAREKNLSAGSLVDMESAGIMDAAERFLFSHQIVLIKIPSDSLEPEKVTSDLVEKQIDERIDIIEETVKIICRAMSDENPALIKTMDVLSCLIRDLQFSETMRLQLEKDIRRSFAEQKNPYEILKKLEAEIMPALTAKKLTKEEGKRIFARIHDACK